MINSQANYLLRISEIGGIECGDMSATRCVSLERSFYHCVSRVVDRRFVFHASEKEAFRSILRKLERFLDVRVATYCLMGNHFHLLLEVPERETLEPLTPESLLRRLPLLYGPDKVNEVAAEFERARVSGTAAWEKEILSRYERRRADLSIFLKELKQRVSIFVNRRLERTGTLWEGRFKSVLVEGGEQALLTVAAYIDLNPVRAGLVKRPEDYRWSGYGEAVGGSKGAPRKRGMVLRRSIGRDSNPIAEEPTGRESSPVTADSSTSRESRGRGTKPPEPAPAAESPHKRPSRSSTALQP